MRAGSTHYKDEGRGAVSEIPDFLTYPRQFITYKWYRPVITGVLTGVLLMLFIFALMIAVSSMSGNSYQSMKEMVMGGYERVPHYMYATTWRYSSAPD